MRAERYDPQMLQEQPGIQAVNAVAACSRRLRYRESPAKRGCAMISSTSRPKPQAGQNLAASKLDVPEKLQAVTNKIHATTNVDEIMLELSQDICELFEADRLTIYVHRATTRRRSSPRSRPASRRSRTSSCRSTSSASPASSRCTSADQHPRRLRRRRAASRTTRNLNFLKEVDKRTGYRTKQMLVAPDPRRAQPTN